MNQNAEAFTQQFTYTICSKGVKASEWNAALQRAHNQRLWLFQQLLSQPHRSSFPRTPRWQQAASRTYWTTCISYRTLSRKNWGTLLLYNNQILGTRKPYSIWDHRVFENCSWKAVPQEASLNYKYCVICIFWVISFSIVGGKKKSYFSEGNIATAVQIYISV